MCVALQAGVVIGTHDGNFHCDEVLAISMLRLLPAYRDAAVVRTRDAAKLAQCHIVVDVGAEYEPDRLRFDHHQREFTGTLANHQTKLSSAGLIYKHFGKQVIQEIVGDTVPDNVVDVLFEKTYVDFMEHIDGIDNGVAVSDEAPRYKVETHMPARVGRLNPSWNEDNSALSQNVRFSLALDLVSREFIDFVSSLAESWWPARQLVEEAFRGRSASHPSGELIVLKQYCPWHAHLFDLEDEAGCKGAIKYVLYDDGKGAWRLQAVPVEVGSFTSRLPFPEKYRGLRDSVLRSASIVPRRSEP